MKKSEKPGLKNVRFHPLAEKEIEKAVDYLNEEVQELGYIFSEEIESCIENIRHFPKMYTQVEVSVRRAIVNNFRYSIFYSEVSEDIFIISIGHHSRHPDYWKSRLKDIPE